ncbi:hypothetical protein V2W45_1256945, partial [Cenococcum geophilum]
KPTLLYSIKPPYKEASNRTYNKDKDSNSGSVSNNWSNVLNLEPAIKHYTRTKKDKINKMSLDNKWEINDILGKRMIKLGREYKVYKSGLLNSKGALKFYQRRVR